MQSSESAGVSHHAATVAALDWRDIMRTRHEKPMDSSAEAQPWSTCAEDCSPSVLRSVADLLGCSPRLVHFTRGREEALRTAVHAALNIDTTASPSHSSSSAGELLTTRYESAACLRVLHELRERYGYSVRFATLPRLYEQSDNARWTVRNDCSANTRLIVLSQCYPSLLWHLSSDLASPHPRSMTPQNLGICLSIRKPPLRIPLIVDMTDSVRWFEPLQLHVVNSAVDEQQQREHVKAVSERVKQRTDEERESTLRRAAVAYVYGGEHIDGSDDIGFVIAPQHSENFALTETGSATDVPIERRQRLVDAFCSISRQLWQRCAQVHSASHRFYELLCVYINHTLDPLHCALPNNAVEVKQPLLTHPLTGPISSSQLVHRVSTAPNSVYGISEQRILLLAFRGFTAEQLCDAFAHPPAGVVHVDVEMSGEALQPVLAVSVPRYLPSVCASAVPMAMRDGVLAFSPPWYDDALDERVGFTPAQCKTVAAAASTVAAVYCHLLQSAYPQWRTTFLPASVTEAAYEDLRQLPIVGNDGSPVALHPSLQQSDAALWRNSASAPLSVAPSINTPLTSIPIRTGPSVRPAHVVDFATPPPPAAAKATKLSSEDAVRGPFMLVMTERRQLPSTLCVHSGVQLHDWLTSEWHRVQNEWQSSAELFVKTRVEMDLHADSLDRAVQQVMEMQTQWQENGYRYCVELIECRLTHQSRDELHVWDTLEERWQKKT